MLSNYRPVYNVSYCLKLKEIAVVAYLVCQVPGITREADIFLPLVPKVNIFSLFKEILENVMVVTNLEKSVMVICMPVCCSTIFNHDLNTKFDVKTWLSIVPLDTRDSDFICQSLDPM